MNLMVLLYNLLYSYYHQKHSMGIC